MTRDRHAVEWTDHGDHRAEARCPCSPVAMRDLNEPAVTIWRHMAHNADRAGTATPPVGGRTPSRTVAPVHDPRSAFGTHTSPERIR